MAGQAMKMASQAIPLLPELVRDTKREARFDGKWTIHTRGNRRQERWLETTILGQGGGGLVSLQRNSADGSLRAVKRVLVRGGKWGYHQYVRELEALSKFSQAKYSDYFVKFFGWYDSPDFLHIAMEYCEHGDLRKYLATVKTLPEDEVNDITFQVLTGVKLMHEAGFANRDIKPANILIKSKPPSDWWVKVCDLGLSKRTETLHQASTVAGTVDFMPPELLGFFHGTARDPAMADMWCLGETVFLMLTGKHAFDRGPNLTRYVDGTIPFPASALQAVGASEACTDFVAQLMRAVPSNRATSAQALEHTWIKSVTDRGESDGGQEYVLSPGSGQLSGASAQDLNYESSGQWTETLQVGGGSTPGWSHGSLPSTAQSSVTAITEPSGQWTATVQNVGSVPDKPQSLWSSPPPIPPKVSSLTGAVAHETSTSDDETVQKVKPMSAEIEPGALTAVLERLQVSSSERQKSEYHIKSEGGVTGVLGNQNSWKTILRPGNPIDRNESFHGHEEHPADSQIPDPITTIIAEAKAPEPATAALVVDAHDVVSDEPAHQPDRAKAQFDFAGEKKGDLPFKEGDVITIVTWDGDVAGWAIGQLNDKCGAIPLNYVEKIEKESEPAATTKPPDRAKALYDCSADKDDQLAFAEGDIITVLDWGGEGAGWGTGSLNGRTGLIPLNYVQKMGEEEAESATTKPQDRARALYDHEAEDKEAYLSFAKGDIITMLDWGEEGADWGTGSLNGKTGFVQLNYIRKIGEEGGRRTFMEFIQDLGDPSTYPSLPMEAKVDWEPTEENCLAFKKGDVVTITDWTGDGDWAMAAHPDGRTGYVLVQSKYFRDKHYRETFGRFGRWIIGK